MPIIPVGELVGEMMVNNSKDKCSVLQASLVIAKHNNDLLLTRRLNNNIIDEVVIT